MSRDGFKAKAQQQHSKTPSAMIARLSMGIIIPYRHGSAAIAGLSEHSGTKNGVSGKWPALRREPIGNGMKPTSQPLARNQSNSGTSRMMRKQSKAWPGVTFPRLNFQSAFSRRDR